MDSNIVINGQPAKWSNADSLDGQVKGTEFNCVEIALHDSGAFDTEFWLQIMSDAPGLSVAEFAKAHPRGSFLVSHIYPDSPPEILPLYWKGNAHYSALVHGTLHNASKSAVENKIDYAFEVLHRSDIEERGINLKEQLIFPKP
jgi:hypothetical protein